MANEQWVAQRDRLARRKRAYQLCFQNPTQNAVLIDLAKFCRANETTFNADPRIHAALEGRREVFLRILQHINLDANQLMALYGAPMPGVDNG